MFCSKCGNKLDLDAKFCTRCGSLVNDINNNKVSNSSNFRTILYNKRKLIIISSILIMLLITSFTAIFNITGSSGRTTMIYMIGSNLESEMVLPLPI